jgi:hypothetical protein
MEFEDDEEYLNPYELPKLDSEEDTPEPVKEKPKRKKRELTPETKQRLLDNLKKGREKAKINRMKKAEAKRIIKQKERKEIDDIIDKDRESRKGKKELEEELESLRLQIKNMKSNNTEEKKESKTDIVKEEKKVEKQPTQKPAPPQNIKKNHYSTFKGSIWNSLNNSSSF